MTGNNNHRKVQMTVRLEPCVFRAAKEEERKSGTPRSVIVANAARQTLIPPPNEAPQELMQDLAKRVLTRMDKLERAMGRELFILKELIALGARMYLNHTPAVPETERDTASLSGRARFVRLLAMLNRNVQDGCSILDDTESHHEFRPDTD